MSYMHTETASSVSPTSPTPAEIDRIIAVSDKLAALLHVPADTIVYAGYREISLTVEQAEALAKLKPEPKWPDDLDFSALVDWAQGHILTELLAGKLRSGVWMALNVTSQWTRAQKNRIP